ncbi:LADA_0C03070g1_1 [Lachancea dasiensis]|uniref:LADA_0C03070g1_1 n=1 Tax=Lachancea dasiensis TaxID=1072105 RepID=A0A1G4IY46_9SACH|nr:LADA_0C03070g1_1 [Lachancea dasiensis]
MYTRCLLKATYPIARTWRLSNTHFVPFRFFSSANLDSYVTPSNVINAQKNLGINITQRAANRLAEISKESSEALRVCVESGGCHGFQYNLKLIPREQLKLSGSGQKNMAAAPEGQDEDFEEDDDFESGLDIVYELPEQGGQVVIDEKSLKVLNNTTLTYTTELIGSTFKITGGNMKHSCGCGSSFDVEI